MTFTPEVIIIALVALLVGALIGGFCTLGISRIKHVGTFHINHSDPTKDFINLQLDCDLPAIEKNKVIGFKVVVE